MDSSVFVFAEDLRGEGVSAVVERVLGYGCDGLTVAAAYHRARDVTPHGPARVTMRDDAVHVPLPPDVLRGLRLAPPQPAHDGFLHDVRERTSRRNARMHGWAVFLHNTTLGLAHPDVTQQNCFGDRAAPADLCPSHSDVRDYAVALARAVARQGVDSVVAESLHFGSFRHGYHHERCFVDLGPVADFLLGLCFCPGCLSRAQAAGVDAEAARQQAAWAVSRVLEGEGPLGTGLTLGALAADVGDALARYARARCETVTTLAASVAEAVAEEGSRLVFLDATGAIKGFADGLPDGGPAVGDAWRSGVDPAALGSVVPGYAVLGYARDPARVAADIAAYRTALGRDCALRVVLRPGQPDTSSAGGLAEKLRCAAAADAVDFYNYGMYPLPVLERIRAALGARLTG